MDDTDSNVSTFTLVTLNCFGGVAPNTHNRLMTMAQELNQAPVDVICLQEVQLWTYVPLLTQRLSNFPFTALEPFLYAPKGGLLTLSRRPLTNSHFTLYNERGHWYTPSLADRVLHKGILATELKIAGRQFTILNTHLAANYTGNWSRTNRYARLEHNQLLQLAEYINSLNPDSIVIVAGDFNIPRQSWLYHDFVQGAGVVDPLVDNRKPTYRTPLTLRLEHILAIDHVFVRAPAHDPVTATAKLIFEEKIRLVSGRMGWLSDHSAIQLRLEWPTAPA